MRILTAGVDGVLVETDDLDEVLALSASLREDPLPGVVELVPGARTVYVRFVPGRTSAAGIAGAVRSRALAPARRPVGELVRVPVVYDGEDLDEVARLCGMSADDVVARHTASTYTVAFSGFAPGFAYLAGGDPELRVSRRESPRTAIPSGAVAIAGEFSGVYPRRSPGGWRLLGRTDAAMWDLDRDPPALLRPGMRVEFTAVRAQASAATPRPNRQPTHVAAPSPTDRHLPRDAASDTPDTASRDIRPRSRTAIEVVGVGGPALIQDLGRPGHADLGVAPSGAMDRGALRRANRLVGNASGTTALETALGGLALRASGPLVVAVTGARVPLRVESHRDPPPHAAAFAVDDGEVLEIGAPSTGVYAYVAVRGGFDVPPVLGSASRDVLAALGPEPLAVGDLIPIGAARPPVVTDAVAPPDSPATLPAATSVTTLEIVPGPRDDWFDEAAIALLTGQEWTVTAESNRIGLRLHGELPLGRIVTRELPSEGTATGSLQVPSGGQPVLFTADHPATGGYPVIACVTPAGLDLAAQVPPGGRIRFRLLGSTRRSPVESVDEPVE